LRGLKHNARSPAVRLRRVVLPDGSVLEQCQESAPSPASEPFCTLVPSAEIIRLTSENAKLKSENERIPALELELEETTAQLGENQAALEASIEEIKRLQASNKVREDFILELQTELENHSSTIQSLQGSVNSLNQSLDAANAENARLAGVNSDTLAEIEKISLDLSSKDAVLHEKDMELEALREAHSPVKKDLQTEVMAKEAALKQVEDLRARLALLNGDKDIIVNKLADDLGKVMEEMQKIA
jgi:chromosome segregation ATPase